MLWSPVRGVSSVKYHLVHLPVRLQRLTYKAIMNLKDTRVQLSIVYLGYLSDLVLLVALGLGLYTQWLYTNNTTILAITILGLFIFVLSCALQYYFSLETVGKALLHIWLGCILGVLVFTSQEDIKYVTTQEVMDILLVTSAGLGWFWSICQQFLHLKKHEPHMFSMVECLESTGFVIASLVTGADAVAISLLVVAFVLNLVAIRFKSLLGVVSLVVMIALSAFVFFPDLELKVNSYGLVCFVGRHVFEPIIDLYFSGLSTLERWQAFFDKSKFTRHIVTVVALLLNITSVALVGRQSFNHKEWFVVVPVYGVFALFWLCFHLIFFISCWKLMSKITECNLTYSSISDDRKSMNRIMASKGIRHFSLISRRLMCLTLLTTVIMLGIGWETRTAYSLSLALMVLPVEAMTLSLFWELGDYLGGTCIGYAVIAPYTGQRSGGGAKLLSAAATQDIGSRATTTLNKIQQFFNFNMIENFGCDFSSSGMTFDYLQSKVLQFFERKTLDGPRFDTYIVYYSGDVYDSGDWALSDNRNLKLDTLLEWWSIKNEQSGSRLILIVDSQYSLNWAKDVSNVSDEFVAIQTCRFTRSPDPEFGEKFSIGTFTEDWVHFNLEAEIDPPWSDKERVVRALYKVSRNWTDFTFHLPTREDIEEHWDSNFPRFTRPLIRGVNFIGTGSVSCCCDAVSRCMKRQRMKWLPPKVTDTGHGFKLVRS